MPFVTADAPTSFHKNRKAAREGGFHLVSMVVKT
jgi:hypothetical protein